MRSSALLLPAFVATLGCGAPPTMSSGIDSNDALALASVLAVGWQADALLITLQSGSTASVFDDGKSDAWVATYWSPSLALAKDNVSLFSVDGVARTAALLTTRTFGESCYHGVVMPLPSSGAILKKADPCWSAIAPSAGDVQRSLEIAETCLDLYGNNFNSQIWYAQYRWTQDGAPWIAELRYAPDGTYQAGEGPCHDKDSACLGRTSVVCP